MDDYGTSYGNIKEIKVAPISYGYGVPAAPVVSQAGGSQGYGTPTNEGYGPSSAVSPFSEASSSYM